MATSAELLLPSGPLLATDWVAVGVTAALETTKHTPSSVKKAMVTTIQQPAFR